MASSQYRFSMQWSIEGFSMCTQKMGEFLKSPVFKEESTQRQEWTMVVYPRGTHKDSYVSVEVHCRIKICAAFEFTISVVGWDGAPLFPKVVSTTCKSVTQSVRFSKFIKRSDLLYKRECLLPGDTLTLQCVICKPCILQAIAQEIVFNTFSHTFFIRDFGSSEASSRCTEPLELGLNKAPKFRIAFCIDRLSDDEYQVYVNFLKIALYRDRYSNYKNEAPKEYEDFLDAAYMDCPLSISFKIFTMNDSNLTKTLFVEGDHVFFPSAEDETYSTKRVKVNKLKYIESGFIVDEALALRVELRFSDGSVAREPIYSTKSEYFLPESEEMSPEESQLSVCEKIYEEKKFCDVVLKVGSESLSAHKAVLYSQSPMFRAMFDSDMTEKNTGLVDIVDFDAETMGRFLKLLYTGKVDETLQWEDLLTLYAAAHQHQVISLLKTVRAILISKITVENVWKLNDHAGLYEDADLKAAVKSVILANSSKFLDIFMNNGFQADPNGYQPDEEIDVSRGQPFKKRRM